jgi:hypothetical protein
VDLADRDLHVVQRHVRFGKRMILGKPKADSVRSIRWTRSCTGG